MNKVYVEVKIKLVMNVNSSSDVSEIINEMDYNFVDNTGDADIVDTEMLDYEIVDSK